MKLAKLGTDYGGWVVPTDRIKADWVCYCVGAGEDISFDLRLIEQFGCHVHTFDPTPRAIAHVQGVLKKSAASERFALASHLHFRPFGVHAEDGPQRFYEPSNPSHVSHSAENLQQTDRYFVAECKTIRTLMRELGHTRIDLLKLDIEGAEHAVIPNLIADGIRPQVLCIEFDAALQRGQYVRALVDLKRLVAFGYDITCIDRWNVTLLARERPASVQTRLNLVRLWLRVQRQRFRSPRRAAA